MLEKIVDFLKQIIDFFQFCRGWVNSYNCLFKLFQTNVCKYLDAGLTLL